MDTARLLAELRQQHRLIEDAIHALERIVIGSGKRRGRPPAWMKDGMGKKRGRPPGSKNKPKDQTPL
jgi:hypothetical protein